MVGKKDAFLSSFFRKKKKVPKKKKKLLLLLLSCVSNVFLLRLSFGVFFLVSFSCVFYEEKKIPQKTFRGE